MKPREITNVAAQTPGVESAAVEFNAPRQRAPSARLRFTLLAVIALLLGSLTFWVLYSLNEITSEFERIRVSSETQGVFVCKFLQSHSAQAQH